MLCLHEVERTHTIIRWRHPPNDFVSPIPKPW